MVPSEDELEQGDLEEGERGGRQRPARLRPHRRKAEEELAGSSVDECFFRLLYLSAGERRDEQREFARGCSCVCARERAGGGCGGGESRREQRASFL